MMHCFFNINFHTNQCYFLILFDSTRIDKNGKQSAESAVTMRPEIVAVSVKKRLTITYVG